MSENAILLLIFCFLLLSVMVSALVDTFRLPMMHFSITSVAIGVICGGTVHLIFPSSDWQDVNFGDRIIFRAALPIIVFATGFSLDVKTFLMNLKSICSIGIIGTLLLWLGLSFCAVLIRDMGYSRNYSDVECLLLGSLLTSSDSVSVIALLKPEASPMLHSVISGEGMLNGVISIALSLSISYVANDRADHSFSWDLVGSFLTRFSKMVSISLAIGIGIGLLSALCVKWLRSRSPTDVENTYIFMWGLIAYFVAEVAESSGVVSVFFCGMTMSHYTVKNISDAASLTTFHSLNSISYSLQACLYTVIGFFAWSFLSSCYVFKPIDSKEKDLFSAIGMLCSMMVVRGVIIPFFLYFGNRKKDSTERVGWRQQLALWYSGLMRGLIPFWLCQSVRIISLNIDMTLNNEGITTTIYYIVVFTTLVGGCFVKPVFRLFGVPTSAEEAAALRSVDAAPAMLQPNGTEEYGELGASDVSLADFNANRNSSLCHLRCSARCIPSVVAVEARASPVTEYLVDLNPSKLQTAIKTFDSRIMQPLFGDSSPTIPQFVTAADNNHTAIPTEQSSLLSFPRVPHTANPFRHPEASRSGSG